MLTQYSPVRDVADQVEEFLTAALSSAAGAAPAAAGEILAELLASRVSAWAAVADGRVAAVVGARLRHVSVGDPDYTFKPARYALVPMSLWHAEEGTAYLGDLLDHVARDARAAGIGRVSIEVPIDDVAAVSAVMRAGFIPDVVLAAAPVQPLVEREIPGIRIRPARLEDRAALVELTLAEADYHATHTSSGILRDQDPAPSAQIVDGWLARNGLGAFVAEDDAGVVGMLPLMYISDGEAPPVTESAAYVASTYVAAHVRDLGVGSALLARAHAAAAARGIKVLVLHYIADNPTGGQFWPARGFTPLVVTYTRALDDRTREE